MNDSSVSNCQDPLRARNAYLLFYERSNRLNSAVGLFKQPGGGGQLASNGIGPAQANGQMGNGKRKEREDDTAGKAFPAQKIKLNLGGLGGRPFAPHGGRPSSPTKQHPSPAGSSRAQTNGHGPPYAYNQRNDAASPRHHIRKTAFFPHEGNRKEPKSSTLVGLMQGKPRN